jgi:hypothetical protein
MFYKSACFVLLSIALSVVGTAQERDHSGQGYVFFAPGVATGGGFSEGTFHFGGGAEGFLYKGLAAGGEIGYVAPWKYSRSGIGLLSFDGSFHLNRSSRLSPFVAGGYSFAFQRSGHANAVNYGGGVNWWVRERYGLRLELRDQFLTAYTDLHYVGFRIGFAFR